VAATAASPQSRVPSAVQRPPWYQARLWHGMEFFAWLRLLAKNRLAISPSRVPMALGLTAAAMFNTALRWLQAICYGRKVRRVEIVSDPVFIIGHWRTGTTMLHELLALDPRHRCPTTYESLCPNHFLLSQRRLGRWLSLLLPRTRPMDNMRVSFDRPQEDEAALCNRGVPSPFATVAFPNRPPQESRYVDLEGLSVGELARWERGMRTFLKELLFVRPGQLVLKSPQHTFRMKVLSQMFPRACFIYLVRDPYVVFPSTEHFWTKMYEVHGLQRPRLESLRDQVFETFAAMHRKLEESRSSVDPARFYELRYEELVADPVAAVEAIYDYFRWPDFDAVRPALARYAQRARRYQANCYALPAELRDEITRRWKPYIEQYGYGKELGIRD
jgi:omega-hydroxy-beta-dihydromenaquinone-9 sulfotransferase